MKKLIILLILLVPFYTNAQEKRFAKIQALKTAHITEALELSPEQAEKFWPIFNAFDEKMHEYRSTERFQVIEKVKNEGSTLTESEANALIDLQLKLYNDQAENRIQLINELRNVITPQQIIKLKVAEETFRRKILDHYRKRNKGLHR